MIQEVKRQACKIFSRVNGWYTSIDAWNLGKKAEWADRKTYDKQLEQND